MGKHFTLDRISNVAFILMCLAVTAVGVQRLTAARGIVRPEPPPPFSAGTRLALHEDLRPDGAKASLLVALSTNCRFCTASMPFYRRLMQLDAVRDGRVRLGVVSVQEIEPMRAYLSTHGVPASRIVHVSQSGVPLQATPTLVLVGGDGAVVRSSSGQLTEEQEAALIKDLQKLSGQ